MCFFISSVPLHTFHSDQLFPFGIFVLTASSTLVPCFVHFDNEISHFLVTEGFPVRVSLLAALVLAAKIACQLRHVRLSVKFDIGYIFENLLRNVEFTHQQMHFLFKKTLKFT